MLQPSDSISANDVTIRCRVRHSPYAGENRQFTDSQPMICRMRIWHANSDTGSNFIKSRSFGPGLKDSNRVEGHHEGPELVLHPMADSSVTGMRVRSSDGRGKPLELSERFASFGGNGIDGSGRTGSSRRGRTQSPPVSRPSKSHMLGEMTICIEDIMIVDMYGEGDSHQTTITTLSSGFFEFTLDNQNGQEILLAFLQANLPQERVMSGSLERNRSGISSASRQSARSIDIEAFTASRMQQRIKEETFAEKLRRKVGKVVSSIEEISTTLTECACACSKNTSISPSSVQSEKRDSPPRGTRFDDSIPRVEMAPATTPVKKRSQIDSNALRDPRRGGLQFMPSGLSVEHDDAEFHVI